ncbi:MAG: PD40 domain-containing protein [Planctomycetes bacterium]|nr:PD40 domain-containing protein [Planctomycetota bacterium]
MAIAAATAAARAQELRLASVLPDGTQVDESPWDVAISGDGDVVAFAVANGAFLPGPNGNSHIYLKVRSTDAIEDPIVTTTGAISSASAELGELSGDGRYLVFSSDAGDLVVGDTNGETDLFVRDRVAAVTTRVSVSSAGVQADDTSGFGRISADGRYVAFSSYATNLVAVDGNGTLDVFLRDTQAQTTERISIGIGGVDANGYSYALDVSDDGRYVLFGSDASNLVAGDINAAYDLFLYDRTLATTELITVSTAGVRSNGTTIIGASMTADGSMVVFDSNATNLVSGDANQKFDIFLRDRNAGTTVRVNRGTNGETNGDSWDPTISTDGLAIAFESRAKNLSPLDPNGHADIYLHDVPTGTTTLVSLSCDGVVADLECYRARLSADGLVVGFLGGATNLDPADANGFRDAFSSDFTNCPIASWSKYGSGWPGTNGVPTIKLNGDPDLGSDIDLVIGNSLGAPTLGVVLWGITQISVPTSLGGTLLVDPLGSFSLTVNKNGSTITESVPYDCTLAGFTLDVQVLEVDPGASKGVSFTKGLELIVGR